MSYSQWSFLFVICYIVKSKRPHTITKMNDNINMDSTITVSINAKPVSFLGL